MRPRDRWHRHVAPVVLELDCNGASHRIRWRRGRIRVLDHDVLAERAMLALGGEPCPCLELLDTWKLTCEAASGRAHRRALPEELRRTATLCRLVAAERRWQDPGQMAERAAFVEDLCRRLRTTLGASLAPSRSQLMSRRKVDLSIAAARPGEALQVEAESRASHVRLQISLPLTWLVEVDGRDLALVDDQVTLAVVDADVPSGALGVLQLSWLIDPPNHTVPEIQSAWVSRCANGTWAPATVGRRVEVGDGPWWSIRVI